jgi:hypothetical protein
MKGISTMKDMKIMKVGSDQRDGIRETDLNLSESLCVGHNLRKEGNDQEEDSQS